MPPPAPIIVFVPITIAPALRRRSTAMSSWLATSSPFGVVSRMPSTWMWLFTAERNAVQRAERTALAQRRVRALRLLARAGGVHLFEGAQRGIQMLDAAEEVVRHFGARDLALQRSARGVARPAATSARRTSHTPGSRSAGPCRRHSEAAS